MFLANARNQKLRSWNHEHKLLSNPPLNPINRLLTAAVRLFARAVDYIQFRVFNDRLSVLCTSNTSTD